MNDARPVEDIARDLKVSVEAVQLTRDCELVDLHLDTFIPHRLWGYDWYSRHAGGPVGRHFFGHVDWPRLVDGGLTGAIWSITTNPFRPAGNRWSTFQRNLARIRGLIDGSDGKMRLVKSHAGYVAAREAGAHAAMLGIQGGNALDAAPNGVASIEDDVVVRITLVHLTNASLGATNSPHHYVRRHKGLSDQGKQFVEQCNDRRVFVDLAHIHEAAFWDAVEVHDDDQPLIVTHTGVEGVTPHWRNITDAQIKAVADTGGVVGIIFSDQFLTRRGGPRDAGMIVEHLEHVCNVAGDDVAAIGSDYDGAISPPSDVPGADTYPVLVQHMLDRGWSAERIRKVLGDNYLASFARLRPTEPG